MEQDASVFCGKATSLYIGVMASVFLLFTGPEGYILLEWKKCLFFFISTGTWLFILTVGIVHSRGKALVRPGYKTQELLLLWFMTACTLSTLLSPWAMVLPAPGGQYNTLLTYCLYALVILGAARFGRAKQYLLYIFLAAYSICCLIALIQLLGYNPLNLFPNHLNYYDPFVQETEPFLGTTGNIDLFSALHCLALPMSVVWLVMGNKRSRGLGLIPLALGLLCVFRVRVASGILALVIWAGLFLAILPALLYQRYGYFSQTGGRNRLLLGVIPVLVLFAGGLIVLKTYPFSGGTLSELHQILNGQISDTFGTSRIAIWKNTLQVISEHPLLGVGPGVLGNVLTVHFSRYSEVLGYLLEAGVDDAHNEYLHHLACFGVLGFFPLFLLQIHTAILFFRDKAYRHNECLVLGAGCFCYMAQAFFNISTCIMTPMICIAWGLLLGCIRQDRNRLLLFSDQSHV